MANYGVRCEDEDAIPVLDLNECKYAARNYLTEFYPNIDPVDWHIIPVDWHMKDLPDGCIARNVNEDVCKTACYSQSQGFFMGINHNDIPIDKENFEGYKGRARQVCKSNGLFFSKLFTINHIHINTLRKL